MLAVRTNLLRSLKAQAQLFYASRCAFSHQPQTTSNATDVASPYSYESLKNNGWLVADPTKKKSEWTHKSTAEQLIDKVPVIYVAADSVRCMVYIKLDTRTPGEVQTCKYCGLRYAKKLDGHHH